MNIESNLKKNFTAIYDEALGVAKNRSKIIKNKKINKLSYLELTIIIFIIILVISIIIAFCNYLISYILIFIDLIYLITSITKILIIYTWLKEDNFIVSSKITKEGIINNSYYDIKMTFKWDKITAVVIKKYSITILTDTPIYFIFNIDDKDILLKEIKKHKKDILIIEK